MPSPGGRKPIAIHLVTVEYDIERNKRVSSVTEKYDTVTEARSIMREYLREFLDDGWTRVLPDKPLRSKPMQLTITDGEYRITCTIVKSYDPPRRLRREPDLSE